MTTKRADHGVAAFHESLRTWQIKLTVRGDEIIVTSPMVKVSPILRKQIEERKAELIPYLKSIGAEESEEEEATYRGILLPPPSPRFLKWIRATLEASEYKTGNKAPKYYHDYLEMARKAIADSTQVIEFEILTDADWERFYAEAFKDN